MTDHSDLLSAANLAKAFGRRSALADVSLSVRPAEIVGLVGPNGAGKSTAFRIICGLLAADSGTVTLDGHDLRRSPQEFKALLGVLVEAPGYYPALCAFEQLAYLARIRGCFRRDRIVRALEQVGLAPDSRKPVAKYSLGMKQRLGIAMAILHEPEFLLLDEPMNGLDPVGMATLRQFLRGLAQERGAGILVSSHLLHEIEQICDRVLFIRDGRILHEAALDGKGLAQTEAVLLRTNADARARVLLAEQSYVQEVNETRLGLECRLTQSHVPRIATLLVEHGLEVWQLTPRRRSLEDVYLSHYSSQTGSGIE
jgi:ABC-2 type transport system ATP-binding protein